jgi:hypothetical protein
MDGGEGGRRLDRSGMTKRQVNGDRVSKARRRRALRLRAGISETILSRNFETYFKRTHRIDVHDYSNFKRLKALR